MNKLLKAWIAMSMISQITTVQSLKAEDLYSILMKSWKIYTKKYKKDDNKIEQQIKNKKMKRKEVLWYKLHNVEWSFNQELCNIVINIWEKCEWILPKWVKVKLNWKKAWLFYKYEF